MVRNPKRRQATPEDLISHDPGVHCRSVLPGGSQGLCPGSETPPEVGRSQALPPGSTNAGHYPSRRLPRPLRRPGPRAPDDRPTAWKSGGHQGTARHGWDRRCGRLRIQGDRLYQMAKDHERRMSATLRTAWWPPWADCLRPRPGSGARAGSRCCCRQPPQAGAQAPADETN